MPPPAGRNLCEHPGVASDGIFIRPAEEGDRRSLAELLAVVAAERDGIATEPPVDVERLAASWRVDGTLVAVADGVLVGEVRVDPSWMGFGELGMMVAAGWRGRGAGTALVAVRFRGRGSARAARPAVRWRTLGPDRDGAAALAARRHQRARASQSARLSSKMTTLCSAPPAGSGAVPARVATWIRPDFSSTRLEPRLPATVSATTR